MLLSAALKATIPKASFEETYAEVAHMKLLQAHLVRVDERAGAAEVFVEEEASSSFPLLAELTAELVESKRSANQFTRRHRRHNLSVAFQRVPSEVGIAALDPAFQPGFRTPN